MTQTGRLQRKAPPAAEQIIAKPLTCSASASMFEAGLGLSFGYCERSSRSVCAPALEAWMRRRWKLHNQKGLQKRVCAIDKNRWVAERWRCNDGPADNNSRRCNREQTYWWAADNGQELCDDLARPSLPSRRTAADTSGPGDSLVMNCIARRPRCSLRPDQLGKRKGAADRCPRPVSIAVSSHDPGPCSQSARIWVHSAERADFGGDRASSGKRRMHHAHPPPGWPPPNR